MADSTSATDTTQQQQPQLQDATQKEWIAIQRRYHAQLITDDVDGEDAEAVQAPSSTAKRVRCFISLSDPDLSERFKGETELVFELPDDYPTQEPVFDFRHYKSRLTSKQFEAIDSGMKARAQELRGTLSLRKLLTWLDNNFYPLLVSTGEVEEEKAGTEEATLSPADITSDKNSAVAVSNTSEVAPDSGSRAETKKAKPRAKKDTSQTPCKFFMSQTCKSGDKCKFSHDVKEEMEALADAEPITEVSNSAPKQAKKQPSLPKQERTKQDKTSSPAPVEKATNPKKDKTSNPAPAEKTAKPKKAKKQPVCKFFAENKCKNGEKCRFLHEPKTTLASEESSEQPKNKGIVIKVLKAAPTAAILESQQQAEASASPSTGASTTSSEDWSEAQQKALDKALKKYPATFDKKIRWISIASEVDGKSLNECIDRFKYLCKIVQAEQPPASESNQEQNTPVEESTGVDKRIIRESDRTAIQTEPEEKGAQIRLEELFLHQIGTLVPHRLVCQVQCGNCPLKFDANLALDKPSIQKWCPRCSVLHLVIMRPVFAHAGSSILAYVDTNENCSVMDVVPSELLATCLECGHEVLFPSVTPTRRSEHACFSCHTKLAMLTKRYVVGQFSTTNMKSKNSSSSPPLSPTSGKKSAQKKLVENFVLGQPLPNKGACEHYRHSYRWFRFQCCGKAFPCDVCHDSSDCPQANLGKIASRMICGLCSKEQSSQVKECACGNEVGKKKIVTSHWEGGAGCRDPNKMSQSDKKKFRGMNKTESRKQTRVGANAKKAREPTKNPASTD